MIDIAFPVLGLVQPNENPAHEIDYELVREITRVQSFHLTEGDRAISWLILTHLYPKKVKFWGSTRKQMNKSYYSYVNDFKLSDWHQKVLPRPLRRKDYPLDNQKLIDSIHKDVVRSSRHIVTFPHLILDGVIPQDDIDYFGGHIRRIERILYVYKS